MSGFETIQAFGMNGCQWPQIAAVDMDWQILQVFQLRRCLKQSAVNFVQLVASQNLCRMSLASPMSAASVAQATNRAVSVRAIVKNVSLAPLQMKQAVPFASLALTGLLQIPVQPQAAFPVDQQMFGLRVMYLEKVKGARNGLKFRELPWPEVVAVFLDDSCHRQVNVSFASKALPAQVPTSCNSCQVSTQAKVTFHKAQRSLLNLLNI